MFVHVALMRELATSMQAIRDETEQLIEASQAKAAIFYSISSTQKGLSVCEAYCFAILTETLAIIQLNCRILLLATGCGLGQLSH